MSLRTWTVLSRNRTPRYQVLECASPLALSNLVCGRKSGRGLPQSKTLARQPLPHPGSSCQCMRKSERRLTLSRDVTQRGLPASRSEVVKVAVGLNPRLAEEQTHAVAERRLNDIMISENSCVAPRRAAVYRSVVRGLKPTATLALSLRDATPEIFGLRQSSAAFALAGAAIEFSYQPVIANRKS